MKRIRLFENCLSFMEKFHHEEVPVSFLIFHIAIPASRTVIVIHVSFIAMYSGNCLWIGDEISCKTFSNEKSKVACIRRWKMPAYDDLLIDELLLSQNCCDYMSLSLVFGRSSSPSSFVSLNVFSGF